jgi:hypothetical protein
MTRHHEQSKYRTSAHGAQRDETELDDEQLERVSGGAAFLSGSLTAQQSAAAWVDNGGGNQNGFIMHDSVVVRTGR